jgi:rhodanese-related sulfurtransferase
MPVTKSVRMLCEEAEREVEEVPLEAALKLGDDPGVCLVDIRDVRELDRDGTIPGSVHAPRDMLEFWVDPESPYYREVFGSGKKFVLFCAAAGRSALAAKRLQDMGFGPVAHMAGGFRGWKAAGGPVAERRKKA